MVGNKTSIKISDEIRPFLNEIAERLWNNRAAIMVGAGFSKNASPDFPDWGQLGDVFYEKAYGKKPEPKDTKYLNVLKLAHEVQATIGRPALEKLLEDKIPDQGVTPSELHVELLNLPWEDVFTTNYDTLLERASKEVISRPFSTVVNAGDLSNAKPPRIVKLHGSFPSQRPFVITEEDYRCYPKENAPFVNTVQQALLEKTLCLIGFSGDDPNFLEWIGWIRDHLGSDKTQKIYLVGVFDLPIAQRQLLSNERGITVVDFSTCDGITSRDHQKAFELFIKFLKRKEKKAPIWPNINWRDENQKQTESSVKRISDITPIWHQRRLNYPNWLILPRDKREALLRVIQKWGFTIPKAEWNADGIDIIYIYELVWQFDRVLLSLTPQLEEACEWLLQKYWPFPDQPINQQFKFLESENHIQGYSWYEIREAWLFIAFMTLRSYREEGALEKWKGLSKLLFSQNFVLSSEQKNFLYYENYLFNLFTLDLQEAKSVLTQWRPKSDKPYWMIKKAAALAEMDELNDAKQLSLEGLQSIRTDIAAQKTEDLSLLSLHAYGVYITKCIHDARPDALFDKEDTPEKIVEDFKKLEEGNSPSTEDEETPKDLRDELKPQKISDNAPFEELSFFDLVLRASPTFKQATTKKSEYEIGQVSHTVHFHSFEPELYNAYAFLRFFEVIGAPFRINNMQIEHRALQGSLNRIAKNSLSWAVALLLRSGNQNLVDEIFGRKAVQRLSSQKCDKLVYVYIKALEQFRQEINSRRDFDTYPFSVRLAHVIPEVLSRLCAKCSRDAKAAIIKFLTEVYASSFRGNYKNIRNLTSRLMKSLSPEEETFFTNDILKIPYPANPTPYDERDFLNPTSFLRGSRRSREDSNIGIENGIVSNLLLELGKIDNQGARSWALQSLTYLYEAKLLNKSQQERFGKILWSDLDDKGFPAETDFYKFAFLQFPSPDTVDVQQLFKNFISHGKFYIQTEQESSSITITGGHLSYCQELLGSSEVRPDLWNKDDISVILDKACLWWDADKKHLKSENERENDVFWGNKEFQARFIQLLKVIAGVIAPNVSTKDKERLQDLVTEMKSYGLHTLSVEAACLRILPENGSELISNIKPSLLSQINNERIDGINALDEIIVNQQAHLKDAMNILAEYIAWCGSSHVADALTVSHHILTKVSYDKIEPLISAAVQRLESLLKDTDYNSYPEDLSFDANLAIRHEAAKLASELWFNFKEKNQQVPKILESWRIACLSEDEFAEIRHLWIR